MAKSKQISTSIQPTSPAQSVQPTKPSKFAALVALGSKLDCDDPLPEDVKQFRNLLKGDPDLWRTVGDLMQRAQHKTLENLNLGKGGAIAKESVKEGADQIRAALGYHEAPMLEQLLIEQCVTAWLRLSVCEFKYSSYTSKPLTMSQVDFWDRTLSAAQRRYLRAIETLARVRRLKLPVLQLNVAEAGAKQLNVAASIRPGGSGRHSLQDTANN